MQYTAASIFTYQVEGPPAFTTVFASQAVPEFVSGETAVMVFAFAITLILTQRRKRREQGRGSVLPEDA